ncbi:hypothetical protein F4679DRAFT_547625 [Xylaria curta]|nr:hypothetical protein F4679DRAFT_547625 [Xylaria curta]
MLFQMLYSSEFQHIKIRAVPPLSLPLSKAFRVHTLTILLSFGLSTRINNHNTSTSVINTNPNPSPPTLSATNNYHKNSPIPSITMDPQTAQPSDPGMLPSSRDELRLRDILNLSNGVIRDDFFPFGANIVEDDDTPFTWVTHLESQGYTAAFMPLYGSERSRYCPIINNAMEQELYEQAVSMDTWFAIHQDHIPTREQIANRNLTAVQRWGPGRPVAFEDLFEFCHRSPRHIRQISQFPSRVYPTAYGQLKACTALPADDWYLGHQPGDPILRIDDDSSSGRIEYLVHWEGVVPFNKAELLQRFTEEAYPNLTKMALAAVTFDPYNRGIHPWAAKMADAINLEFGHSEAQTRKTLTTKLLLKLWTMRYSDKVDGYPFFLKFQLNGAWSAFREIGWLLNELKATHDSICTTHFWANCKNLVQKMSGASIEVLAWEHRNITLCWEAAEMLRAGQLDNMVIYTQCEGAKKVCVTLLFGLNFSPFVS